jgi:hypothetical protein
MSKRLGASLLLGYAVAADVIVSIGLPPALAVLCLAPLVLFAPGYACVLALGLADDARLPGRRVLLAVALSMGFVALGGLLLNAITSLDETSWSEWLVGLTCVFAIAALARDFYDDPRFTASRPRIPAKLPSAPSWQTGAAGAVVILAFAAAATLTETSSHSEYNKPVTQLTLLPVRGSFRQQLRLTVTNLSSRAQRVTLTVSHGAGRASATALVVPASKAWSLVEPAYAGGVQAALTRTGEQHAFSEVAWTG